LLEDKRYLVYPSLSIKNRTDRNWAFQRISIRLLGTEFLEVLGVEEIINPGLKGKGCLLRF
jgi:hypothetical protein